MMMEIWEYGSHWCDITVTNLVCTIVCLPLAHTYTLPLSFCKMFRFAISSKNVCLSAKFLFPRWKFVHTIKFSVQLVVFLLFIDETHKILHWNTILGNQTQTRQKKNCGKKRSERLEKKKHTEKKRRSETEIDDTKNKLECNLVSMNFVGSSGRQEQTNALIFN